MRIVTSGTTQTLEEINVPSGVKRKAFTQGEFFDRRKDKSKGISFEESFSAQSLLFPLPWLYANSIGDDIGIENMGVDNFAGVPVKHLRATKTFASDKTLQVFSKFTTKNIWLDPNSGLPLKIGFDSRTAGGAVAPIAIALEYSDYRSVQGYLYPFHIRKYVNGTLWADIHVQDVRFNTGVAASEFSTQ